MATEPRGGRRKVQEIIPSSRAGVAATLAIMVGIMAVGCSRQKTGEDAMPSGETAAQGARGESQVLSPEQQVLQRLHQTTALLDLYKLRDAYKKSGTPSEKTLARIEEKIQEALSRTRPLGSLVEGLDLVAFDYRYVSENEYETLWLCRARKDITTDYQFILYGFPDESQFGFLSEQAKANGKEDGNYCEVWSFSPEPRSNTWKAGEYVVFGHRIAAQPIPYNMRVRLLSKETGLKRALLFGWWAAVAGDGR